MAKITIYLDEETAARMKAAAKAAGKSQSRWLADLVRERAATEWPESVLALSGAWADAPTAEAVRSGFPPDAPREPV